MNFLLLVGILDSEETHADGQRHTASQPPRKRKSAISVWGIEDGGRDAKRTDPEAFVAELRKSSLHQRRKEKEG